MDQGEIDWEMETDVTGPMIDILKAFVDISKSAAAANSPDLSDPNAIQALLDKCLTFEKRQLKWYGSHLWYPGRGPLPSKPDSMFGTPYRFRLLDDARLHQMFWMSLSSLYTLIDQLEVKSLTAAVTPEKSPVFHIPHLEDENPPGSSPQAPNLFDSSLQDPNLYNNPPDVSSSDVSDVHAEMIARTIPYCLQNSMNLWGVCFVCVSIKYISNTFIRSQNVEKFFWCLQLLTVIGEHGFDFCVFLRDFLLKRWFEEVQQSPRTWEEMNEYSSVDVGVTEPLKNREDTFR
ncbi:hypothetical protein N7493_004574 [Penicillium malachiteum]|uniref:Uncharacterized protein n=1 Tax=Penicillium malachiteum TaxID=1324776 RepID=A0AAD6HNS9_9EURO|nr:hypothetical protein N7493_004574 [Penicillium malachiteum]